MASEQTQGIITEIERLDRQSTPADVMRRADRALEDTEWKPIETAPTDGTEVWVYVQGIGYGTGLKSFQCVCAYHPDAGWCADDIRTVTHWRPLPPPPTKEKPHDRE